MQKFVDVSNNNGHVDFHAIKKAGAVGVYLKVTEGTTFVDSYYASNYKAAKAAGLKVGGYHFAHPKNSPSAELAHFLSHLKLEKGDLKPALDLEVADGMISSRVHAFAVAFLNGLKAKIGERGVIYSGSYFLSANGLLGVPELKWIASYGARPRSHWDAWQFSDGLAKYPGAICHLDTSMTPSIGLFVYKAPISGRLSASALRALHGGYFMWREWRLGIGRWKGRKPADKASRPHILRRIPWAWWNRLMSMMPKKGA